MIKRFLFSVIAICLMVGSFVVPSANAADLTDVADSFDYENNNPFDFRLRVSYQLISESATIARERCRPSEKTTGSARDKAACGAERDQFFEYWPEFSASRTRHAMVLAPSIGLFKDLELNLRIPIIFSEVFSSSLIAKGGASASSLLQDGIVKKEKMDSRHGAGFGDMSIGWQWGIFNDYRDYTKGTWVIGMTWTIPTGTVWDPKDPRKEQGGVGVGRGAHVLSWHVAVSKRWFIFDPYARIRYSLFMVPQQVNTRLQQGLNPRSAEPRVVERALAPSHFGEIIFGNEFVFWENRDKKQKVVLDLRFIAYGQFEGRNYNIFTDMLADFQPTGTIGQDVDQPLRTSLITDHEQYFSFGGHAALHFQLGKFGFLRILGAMQYILPYFITFAKRGVDKNGNGFVDPGDPNEEYPYHVRQIDGIGKRIQQRDTWTITFQVFAGLTL